MPKSNIDTSPKNVPNIFSLGIIAAAILLSLHGAIFGKRSHGLVIKNGSSLGTKASSFCRKTIILTAKQFGLAFARWETVGIASLPMARKCQHNTT